MNINEDFQRPALVHAAQIEWVASPMPGVDRRMLDRVGDEVARATSIVRYAPGSSFSAHTHNLGEEFLVLEGVFQDEHGDFPAGSYVRNPPTSSHTPRSDQGCVIFVKLRQFEPSDRLHVLKRPNELVFVEREQGEQATLHQDDNENVTLEKYQEGSVVAFEGDTALELFCLKGKATLDAEIGSSESRTLEKDSWLRMPRGNEFKLSMESDSLFWIKRGPFVGLLRAGR